MPLRMFGTQSLMAAESVVVIGSSAGPGALILGCGLGTAHGGRTKDASVDGCCRRTRIRGIGRMMVHL